MAVFAVWGQYYIKEINKNNLRENMKKYEKEKTKQQKS
jgi:hypothetical protein